MPTHELISENGSVTLSGLKYLKSNSVNKQWAKSFSFLWSDAFQPASGFHANATSDANASANVNANANSDGWLFESKGNLFQARMKAILGGGMKGLYDEVVDHCKLNGKSANDTMWIEQFCPYSLEKGSMSQRIIEKLAKKSDDRFLTRIVVEFFGLRTNERVEVLNMFKEIDLFKPISSTA